uniref:Uncharacterized protein n=1 Tax=Arabidopsis thaliana TaxID=3702 RepID=Q0WQ25_ARATH|nr:hypothetical protein [Arabidopsis thaliana]
MHNSKGNKNKWHSTGTYDCQSRTGGPFRTMRFDAEQVNGANYGIQIALRLLDPIRCCGR